MKEFISIQLNGDATTAFSDPALGSQIFEGSPDCVKLLDSSGNIVAMNQNGRCVMEIDDFRAVSGMHWKSLWPEQSHAEIDNALAAAVAGGMGHFSAFCPTVKGTPRWWDVTVMPVGGPGKEIENLLVVSRDVTAARQATLELQASEERYRTLFESMDQGFCVVEVLLDATGQAYDYRYLETNPVFKEHTGLSDVLGKSAREVIPNLDNTWYQTMGQVAATGMSLRFENGALGRWFDVHAARIGGSGSNKVALLFRDITDRKRIEQELQEASRRKDEFLAMLAHELRNPLAPIGAAAELLQSAMLDEAHVRKTSEIIGRQVDHMTHLIDDLLDVSRVTRGLVELDNAPLDITQIVTDAVEQVAPLVRSRRHQLSLHLSPDTAMVRGDKKRLVQVLANILNNAAKYTRDGGTILLKTDVRESQVLIEVTDNGIGMTPDLTARAFDLFAQAERTSDRSSGGLGLGLALAKSLVELHGGTVTCASEGLGKGSKFSVRLPRLLVPDRQSGRPHSDLRSGQAINSLRIMVVDDNEDAASMLTMLLEASGHEVVVEHGSHKALKRARTEVPDVFLLDIGLPEMDGNELAQHLRSYPETAKSVLIAVTGYGQESDRRRTLAAGFDHHLVKPVNTGQLTAILADIGNV